MTEWLIVAPERPDDEALAATAWIALKTVARAGNAPAMTAPE